MAGGIPTVAAVIVGTNERDWIGAALDSLQRSAGQGSRLTLDIFYVDNNSRDGSSAYVRAAYPHVRVFENEVNLGFAAANNLAMRRALDAGADYVFLVNPDTYTPPDLVCQLTEFMQDWRGYGIVGPLQWEYSLGAELIQVTNAWTRAALAAGERHALSSNRASLAPPRDPGTPRGPQALEHAYVQGAALFARGDLLRRIGLFDETYHTFYEETDLCRRARLAGWRVALLTAFGVYHHGGGGGGSSYRRLQMMRNKYYFLLTDIDLKAFDMFAIISGWVRHDLAGDGVGGRSTIGRAWLEFARSLAWLLTKMPDVTRRRRFDAALRAAIDVRPF